MTGACSRVVTMPTRLRNPLVYFERVSSFLSSAWLPHIIKMLTKGTAIRK